MVLSMTRNVMSSTMVGSVMFLFESSAFGLYLHSGDFRYSELISQQLSSLRLAVNEKVHQPRQCDHEISQTSSPQMRLEVNETNSRYRQVDRVFLDATYAHPENQFKTQVIG